MESFDLQMDAKTIKKGGRKTLGSMSVLPLILSALLYTVLFAVPLAICGQEKGEIVIDADTFKKLETFESHSLSKADVVFRKTEYRQAAAEYDAFVLQFSKSKAIPYAILRKGRCLQLDNKRFEAIKVYQEILDYFPKEIHYAAAALYYTGECHFSSGNIKEAMKAWAEMASDKDYRTHYLAAAAINQLANNLVKGEKIDEAVAYYIQVAADFRTLHPDAARYALERGKYCSVWGRPNEAALRQLYDKAKTFKHNPAQPSDSNYWKSVSEFLSAGDPLAGEKTREVIKNNYAYWAPILAGKLNQDGFNLIVADLYLAVDGDAAKWIERVDQAYQKNHTADDFDRVTQWIMAYAENKKKVAEYYTKYNFAKMSNAQISGLMYTVFHHLRDSAMGGNIYRKLQFDKMSDQEKLGLSGWLRHEDIALAVECCLNCVDKDRGLMEALRICHWRNDAEKGLPFAEKITGSVQYGKEATWLKAELLHKTQKYAEAIQAYKSADNPPDNLFGIAACLHALDKRNEALAQLGEIEGLFAGQAAQAAWRKALIWRKDEKQYIAALRNVMKKYPKSGESSQAHQELQRLGVKIGGGMDAE